MITWSRSPGGWPNWGPTSPTACRCIRWRARRSPRSSRRRATRWRPSGRKWPNICPSWSTAPDAVPTRWDCWANRCRPEIELCSAASGSHALAIPSEDRPYVAVATLEGVLVNQHLGEAEQLAIFRPDRQRLPTGGNAPHAAARRRTATLAGPGRDAQRLPGLAGGQRRRGARVRCSPSKASRSS